MTVKLDFDYTAPVGLEACLDEFFGLSDSINLDLAKQAFNKFYTGSSDSGSLELDYHFLGDIKDKLDRGCEQVTASLLCVLYISLGCFGHINCEDQVEKHKIWNQDIVRFNTRLVAHGFFPAIVQQLYRSFDSLKGNPAEMYQHTCDINFAISIIFLMMQSHAQKFNERFVGELDLVCPKFIAKLFQMVTYLNDDVSNIYYPIKKVLVVLWKALEIHFGTFPAANEYKNAVRECYGLAPRKPSPPHGTEMQSKTSIYEIQHAIESVYERYVGFETEREVFELPFADVMLRYNPFAPDIKPADHELVHISAKFIDPVGPVKAASERVEVMWKNFYLPVADIQMCEEYRHMKIPDAFPVINRISNGNSMTNQVHKIEGLYAEILAQLPVIIVSLLKILLTVATKPAKPNPKDSAKSIGSAVDNILQGTGAKLFFVNDKDIDAKLALEYTRNQEVVAQSISFILLLLLKHSKLSHVLQFENVCQFLVDANFILLSLKIFNQDMNTFLVEKEQRDLDFQRVSCFLFNENIQVTSDSTQSADKIFGCRRNMNTIINLLRILQKTTKKKGKRIGVMVDFKSVLILKKLKKFEHETLYFYALKLFKSMMPFLGKQWRMVQMANMRIISLCCFNLRPELVDTWLNVADVGKESFEKFSEDDKLLRQLILHYQMRKYPKLTIQKSSSKSLASDRKEVGQKEAENSDDEELDEIFKNNYEIWLEEEVFSKDGFTLSPVINDGYISETSDNTSDLDSLDGLDEELDVNFGEIILDDIDNDFEDVTIDQSTYLRVDEVDF